MSNTATHLSIPPFSPLTPSMDLPPSRGRPTRQADHPSFASSIYTEPSMHYATAQQYVRQRPLSPVFYSTRERDKSLPPKPATASTTANRMSLFPNRRPSIAGSAMGSVDEDRQAHNPKPWPVILKEKLPHERQILVLLWIQTVVQTFALLGLLFGGLVIANKLARELESTNDRLAAVNYTLNTTVDRLNVLNVFGDG